MEGFREAKSPTALRRCGKFRSVAVGVGHPADPLRYGAGFIVGAGIARPLGAALFAGGQWPPLR